MSMARDSLGVSRASVIIPSLEETAALSVSAVSWAAVLAGGIAAIGTTIILLELGAGLGFASVSAWSGVGARAATVGLVGGLWLIFAQWISAAIGGYLAGRLRTKWTGLHTNEVFFRDTAHGFLSWCAATVVTVIVIALVAGSAVRAGSNVAGGAAQGATQGAAIAAGTSAGQNSSDNSMYFTDMLFRPAPTTSGAASTAPATPAPAATDLTATPPSAQTAMAGTASGSAQNAGPANAAARGEISRVMTRDLAKGDLTPDDRTYIAQTVAARTGMSQADAEKRVDQVVAQVKDADNQARQAAEKARKTAATVSITTALAMLVGAFIASIAGALGGRLRDEI